MLTLTNSELLACVGGGVLAGLVGALLRAPAERLLGNVPRERLLDLQDLEQPLLRKLAQEAPGTWEHSRAMANLAEQAASAIGVDALLTRVGAYYHDLGKTAQAKYFVENLGPDERSPHDELDPDVSADAIMAHVVLGTKILRDGGIPSPWSSSPTRTTARRWSSTSGTSASSRATRRGSTRASSATRA